MKLGSARWALSLAGLAACEAPNGLPATATSVEPVIYGTDDRVDYYAAGPGWQQIMGNAVVALIDRRQVDSSDPANVQILGSTLEQSIGTCAGQRFAQQTSAAMCSGTLIDDDLVLTAGHCVDSTSAAACTYKFVFNFVMSSASEQQTITSDDVYSCRAVVVRQLTSTRSESHDFSILRLDRPATPRHQPARLRTALEALTTGTGVNLIGFPEGIPAKFAPGATVHDNRASTLDYFEANIDSFEGNSGSGVYDNDGRVVGIAVAGQQDWSYRGSCAVANTLPDNGSRGLETVSYAADAIRALCRTGYSSARLCGTASCGDGRCDTGEPASCPADCAVLDGGVLPDGGPQRDASLADAALPDAAPRDAGVVDAGSRDSGTRDAAARDSGLPDATAPDATLADDAGSTTPDAAFADSSIAAADAGARSVGSLDARDRSGCTSTGLPAERSTPVITLLALGCAVLLRRRR